MTLDMTINILFSIAASTVGIAGSLPYLWNSLFRDTRPHVFTWFIWSITNWVAVAGLWVGGGGAGAIAPTIGAIFATVIFFISLRFGKRDIKSIDVIVLIFAMLALACWLVLDNLLLAVVMVSIIDGVGYIPTFRKSYSEPYTETLVSWMLFALAPIFAIVALTEYNSMTMTYLVTVSAINVLMFVFLLLRRNALHAC